MKINVPIGILGLTAALFLMVMLYLWAFHTASAQLDSFFIEQPAEQNNTDRLWKKMDAAAFAEHRGVLAVSTLKFGSDGYLYAADDGNMAVNIYDKNLALMNTLGRGEGRGAGARRIFNRVSNVS